MYLSTTGGKGGGRSSVTKWIPFEEDLQHRQTYLWRIYIAKNIITTSTSKMEKIVHSSYAYAAPGGFTSSEIPHLAAYHYSIRGKYPYLTLFCT